jgi:hypothetical protein
VCRGGGLRTSQRVPNRQVAQINHLYACCLPRLIFTLMYLL